MTEQHSSQKASKRRRTVALLVISLAMVATVVSVYLGHTIIAVVFLLIIPKLLTGTERYRWRRPMSIAAGVVILGVAFAMQREEARHVASVIIALVFWAEIVSHFKSGYKGDHT